jgi:hypothetical protein
MVPHVSPIVAELLENWESKWGGDACCLGGVRPESPILDVVGLRLEVVDSAVSLKESA